MDSIAGPVNDEDAMASATIRIRMSARPLFRHCTRYAGPVGGDAIVLSIVSLNWRSTLASCSGEITKWSLSSEVRGRTVETASAPVRGAVVGAAPA
eukprot:3486139-Pleurochrysis_carterae.AAC.2